MRLQGVADIGQGQLTLGGVDGPARVPCFPPSAHCCWLQLLHLHHNTGSYPLGFHCLFSLQWM